MTRGVKKEGVVMNKGVFLMIALCGVACMPMMQAVFLVVCNDTGEKLPITVYWKLPGNETFDLFTRFSSPSKLSYPMAYFTKQCRVFGPVPAIRAFTWFTQKQWDSLTKEDKEALRNSSKTSKLAGAYYAGKKLSLSWYDLSASGFGANSVRFLHLSKDKSGKIFVSQDEPLSEKFQSIWNKIKGTLSKDVDLED